MDRGGGLLIEGYASLFGVEDLSGDVVRAGAFARSLARGDGVPMLLQHRGGQVAGVWTRIREDGRGLFLRQQLMDRVERFDDHGNVIRLTLKRGP